MKRKKTDPRFEEAKRNPGKPAWRGKRHRRLRITGRGGKHGRTMNYFNAATRRLAWEDYQKVSVSMICRNARGTTDGFYRRFPSKPAFEYALVRVTFQEMTRNFSQAMDPAIWKNVSPRAIIYRLVDEVIASTMNVPTIGVTQLAIRITMSKPKGAEPYLEFRQAIMDRAVELLAPKLEIPNSRETVRNAFQMVLAIATDEAWRHGIPFKTQRKRELVETYGNMVFHCLQLPPGRRNPKNAGAIHSDRAEFPEHFKIAYGIAKQSLAKYEKDVNFLPKAGIHIGQPGKSGGRGYTMDQARRPQNREADKTGAQANSQNAMMQKMRHKFEITKKRAIKISVVKSATVFSRQ